MVMPICDLKVGFEEASPPAGRDMQQQSEGRCVRHVEKKFNFIHAVNEHNL
jgi:hypothetical protein